MKFDIDGIDKVNGENRFITIEGDCEGEALAIAKEDHGILPTSIKRRVASEDINIAPEEMAEKERSISAIFFFVSVGLALVLGITVSGIFFFVFGFISIVLLFLSADPEEVSRIQQEKVEKQQLTEEAELNRQAKIVCPHCHERGGVRTKPIRLKKGISGGKATAAVITGGVSLIATGLSRKEEATEANCENCGCKWYF